MMSRPWNSVVCLAVAVAAVSCAPDQSASTTSAPAKPGLTPPSAAPVDPARPAAPAGTAPMAQAEPAPVVPANARYTMYVADYSGPGHVLEANRMKSTLRAKTGMKDWYIVHADDHSSLYYGFYHSFEPSEDPVEGGRAQADRKAILAIADPASDGGTEPLFKLSHFVPLDAPDPTAPKEWDLVNAKGYWSLQVATFKDSPERKQAAIDAVREFRARGIDAYYHHNEVVSCVFIGAWPREAVKEQDVRDDAHSDDPTQPLLVLPAALPKGADPNITMPDGTRVKAVVPRIEVVDPDMKKTLAEFPNNYINGEVYGNKQRNPDGSISVTPDPSLIVIIPHDESQQIVNKDGGTPDANGQAGTDNVGLAPILDNPRSTPPPAPQQPQTPQRGTLRSLGG